MFVQAVVEADFHRCTIPYSVTEDPPYDTQEMQMYDVFEFVYPAATHAICAADVGKCYLKNGANIKFHEHGLTPCQDPGSVVIVADLQDTGLSLWAEGVNDCSLDSVRWNTWPELKPPTTNSLTAWSKLVQRKIFWLLEDTASKANTDDGVKLVPTGAAWTGDLLESLRDMTGISVHEVSHPEFAASLNAATVARWEERSRVAVYDYATNRYETDVKYFSGGSYMWGFYDELWTVGGHCIKDQECKDRCKWKGAPVCHPADHVCMCGELWEQTPGAAREKLYEKVWEQQQSAVQELTAMCKAISQDTCKFTFGYQ